MSRKRRDHNKGRPSKLLVIRLSAMGDVAICVPVLLALTRQYPALQVTMLSKTPFHPIFEDIEGVTFYGADVKGKHKGLRGLYRLFTILKKTGFDGIADLHGVIRSHVLGGFFQSSGVLLAKINKGRKDKRALTRPGNKELKPLKSTQERYMDVFDRLGFSLERSKHYFLPKKKLIPGTAHLFEDGRELKFVGIAPFAAHNGKQYPLSLMRQVMEALEESGKYRIFLFGGGSRETETLTTLAHQFKSAVCIAGRFALSEELTIISNLHVMLAMDSGNGHLAAMYGVPVVTLWGVTHPSLGFVPHAQPVEHQLMSDRQDFPLIPTSVYGNKMPRGYERAMYTIRPERVVSQLIKILEP